MALDLRTGDLALTVDAGTVRRPDGSTLDARRTVLASKPTAETVSVVVDGTPHTATVERDGATTRVWVRGTPIEVEVRTEADLLLERFGLDAGDAAADREIKAPMPGLVLRVLVRPGDAVEAGQGVVVLEAMKMENELSAPASGTVAAVRVAAGDAVGKGDVLVEVDA